MLVLLSPSKSVTQMSAPILGEKTDILFPDISKILIEKLQSLSRKKLSSALQISKSLGELNYNRYQNWNNQDSKPAIWLYSGDVYNGLDSFSFNKKQADYAQKHLLIISGLYGLVRPYDAIKPYRLEMKLKFKTKLGKDLYTVWSDRIAEYISKTNENTILMCASQEYAKAVIGVLPAGSKVITPRFYQKTEDGLQEKGLFAKYARGALARYVVDNQLETLKGLQNYSNDNFAYSEKLSNASEIVYIIPKDFTLKGRFVKK